MAILPVFPDGRLVEVTDGNVREERQDMVEAVKVIRCGHPISDEAGSDRADRHIMVNGRQAMTPVVQLLAACRSMRSAVRRFEVPVDSQWRSPSTKMENHQIELRL